MSRAFSAIECSGLAVQWRGFALLAALALFGCAQSAPNLTEEPLTSPVFQEEIARLTPLAESVSHDDRLLTLQEVGRLNQLVGNPAASNKALLEATRLYAEQDLILIGSGKTVDFLQSTLSNDMAFAYSGTSAERIFAHSFQILNHLQLGDLNSAFVAARRTIQDQDAVRSNYETRVESDKASLKAAQEESKGQKNYSRLKKSLAADASLKMRTAGAIAPGTYSGEFQNPWAYVLAALVFALDDNPNAIAMAKRAVQLLPENEDVGRIARWIAVSLNQSDRSEREALSSLYPEPEFTGPVSRLVVFIEQGYAQKKQEFGSLFQIPIATSQGRLEAVYINFALPYYKKGSSSRSRQNTVALQNIEETDAQNEGAVYTQNSHALVNVNRLNQADLSRNYSFIYSRLIIRMVAKAILQNQLEKSAGPWGGLVGNIYNIASEQADLRAWNTLPSNIQLSMFEVPAGRYRLSFGSAGRTPIDLEPGLNIVRIFDIGSSLRIDQIWPTVDNVASPLFLK